VAAKMASTGPTFEPACGNGGRALLCATEDLGLEIVRLFKKSTDMMTVMKFTINDVCGSLAV
jgi:hypothetical protein